jgi:lipid II isoglutaminyl synthase (glutamine-hydrolysing)
VGNRTRIIIHSSNNDLVVPDLQGQHQVLIHMFYITHLYPLEMSIYGDHGNILAIQSLLKKLGVEFVYQKVELGQNIPEHNDFIFIGGGQDKDQIIVANDLMNKKETLVRIIEDNCPLLAICGGYQLLGHEFIAGDGTNMKGLEIFPVVTKSMDENVKNRCIGNIIVKSNLTGKEITMVGFENHGGQTKFIDNRAEPLGQVIKGYGNNFEDNVEGCVYKNAIGTYCHGSFLPKNPEITRWLIDNAMERKLEKGETTKEELERIQNVELNLEIALAAKNILFERFV